MTSGDDKENKDEIDKDKSENDVEEKSEPALSELEVLQKKYDENYDAMLRATAEVENIK